jgi:hypothetical protein
MLTSPWLASSAAIARSEALTGLGAAPVQSLHQRVHR